MTFALPQWLSARLTLRFCAAALLCFLAACASRPPEGGAEAEQRQIALLTTEIMGLGADVDPDEAARAAALAYAYTRQLAIEYEIEDRPLVHNTKVNMGIKPRGLCWHWAEDMEKRLKQEAFETLDMHRGIANAERFLYIDHSTAIISAKGDGFDAGIVLDPWRWGGVLFWGKVSEDKEYKWIERTEVLAKKRQALERKAAREAWKNK